MDFAGYSDPVRGENLVNCIARGVEYYWSGEMLCTWVFQLLKDAGCPLSVFL